MYFEGWFDSNFITIIKWGVSFRWSFRPNSAWGSIETMTIGKTRLTLAIYRTFGLWNFDRIFRISRNKVWTEWWIFCTQLFSYGILLITAAMTILGMLITCVVIIQGLFCDAKLCVFREPEERPGIGQQTVVMANFKLDI